MWQESAASATRRSANRERRRGQVPPHDVGSRGRGRRGLGASEEATSTTEPETEHDDDDDIDEVDTPRSPPRPTPAREGDAVYCRSRRWLHRKCREDWWAF